MFPEHRLLHEKLSTLNRIAVKETYLIIDAKVVWIGQTIVTHFIGFPRVYAHCVGHFIQPFEERVEQCEAGEGYHNRVPENFVDSSSAQVVLEVPVR